MRIAFDIDGVLAAFVPAYQKLFVETTGRDTFLPGDNIDPPTWNWPELRGYTKEETTAVWEAIKRNETFWLNLGEEENNVQTLRTMLRTLESRHDVYFITTRMGVDAKKQTDLWLFDHLAYPMRAPSFTPTTLLAGYRMKGEIAKGLQLDAYIDDNFDNICDVVKASPGTSAYLLNRNYNVNSDWQPANGPGYTRVLTLGAMFDIEIAKNRLY